MEYSERCRECEHCYAGMDGTGGVLSHICEIYESIAWNGDAGRCIEYKLRPIPERWDPQSITERKIFPPKRNTPIKQRFHVLQQGFTKSGMTKETTTTEDLYPTLENLCTASIEILEKLKKLIILIETEQEKEI